MSIGGWLFRRAADAAVPGSGVALGLLEKLKPLIPYLLAIVAVLGVGLYIHHRGYMAGKAEIAARYDGKMAQAKARMTHARDVLSGADSVLRAQSASIRSQVAAQNAALSNARKLIAEADKRDVSRRAEISTLKAAAARPVEGTPCDSLPEVKDAWK
jgi:hypothetical protein